MVITVTKQSPQDEHTALRPYQKDGVAFLASSTSALLADQMGLGKTVQACKALAHISRANAGSRSLIVCPAALTLNWQVELQRWSPELVVRRMIGNTKDRSATYLLPVSVLIASYEQIRNDRDRLMRLPPFGVVVLDEAQRIKGSSSAISLACKLIPRERSWALTGTPLENRPEDLISIFGFLLPGLLSRGMTLSKIHKEIERYFLRRTKDQVLKELPPIIIKEVELELHPKQRQAYATAWASRYEHKNASPANLLALITKLKQICNFDAESGESSKLEALNVILENHAESEDKLLIFSQYVSTLKRLSLSFRDFPHQIYSGEMSTNERNLALDRFREGPGPQALFISLKAGGVGLNLNEANSVVLFDRWWNPALERQALERAHRFGRTRPLIVYRLKIRDSIEERIEALLEEKSELFRDYIEDAPSADALPGQALNLRAILDIDKL